MQPLSQIVFISGLIIAMSWTMSSGANKGIQSVLRFLNHGLTWSVPARGPVAMSVQDITHYDLDTEDSAMEYEQLLPSGGHIVHLGKDASTHTVSMFHQLKCLDLIRKTYVSPGHNQSTSFPEHCLNYLRQRFLCRPDLLLESARDASGTKSITNRPYEAVCRDWTAVYHAAEENHERYTSMFAKS